MTDVAPPPQLSPDGKNWWDGTAWQPVAGASKASHNRVPGIVAAVGAALTLIGCALPWLLATAPLVGTITKSGLQGDGLFVCGLAIFAGALGLVAVARPTGKIIGLGILLAALAAIWILVIDYQDVNGRVSSMPSGIVAEIGAGIYLAFLGVAVWAVGGIMSLVRPSS